MASKKSQNKVSENKAAVKPTEPKKTAPKKEESHPDAVIMNGNIKVRTYTYEAHGKDYKALAEEFVSRGDRKGYTIKYVEVETRITCPKCGHKFRA